MYKTNNFWKHWAVACLLISFSVGCGRTTTWSTGGEICNNQIDDDWDGFVDCLDSDCLADFSCMESGLENCSNQIDDDKDGFVDCQDIDCQGDPACSSIAEDCINGLDDDEDGLIDCNDPECFTNFFCKSNPEICDNKLDDDQDGLLDCNDPQCFGDPLCQGKVEICDNAIDDDLDGFVDCNDPECFSFTKCQANQEICDNQKDDDGDSLIDCDDPQCITLPACKVGGEICSNGKDDDMDKAIDCDDSDCASDPSCQSKLENCSNKIDEDKDGLIDCNDPDCFKHAKCKIIGKEVCNNNVDDDEDDLIDCMDSDCSALPICSTGKEDCANHIDDDKDGAIDCDDPDCKNETACISLMCKPDIDFGTLKPKGSTATRTLTTKNTTDTFTSSCVIPGGGEAVAAFTLVDKTDLKLTYRQQSGDHAFALFKAGVGEPCNANPLGCYDPESNKVGDFSIKNLEAGLYYIIAEAFAKTLEGQVIITLRTGHTNKSEICNNGIDDDGDLAIDCADLDCTFHGQCTNQVCKYDFNMGSLVVNGPAKAANIVTLKASNNYDLTCSGGGGGEKVVRFVMPSAAILGATIKQDGWHSFGVYRDKGPGTKCTAGEGKCIQKQWQGIVIDHGVLEKGVYYYIVDAMNKSTEGTVNLSLKAYQNRGPELCGNQIDDDGDGLVDCLDPECTGVLNCPGPICLPDYKTGPLVPGAQPTTLSINTKTHNNDQTVSCALGGGKDAVIEIDLPQVTALKVACGQTGDHVIGLFSQGQPRDPCDKNPEGCADPQTGPIGCNYYWGNMQPGKYFLVVEAFQPGAEGNITLSLQASTDNIQEICDNGIDDDGDKKVDCQDYNCADSPLCFGKTCTPDMKVGIIPSSSNPLNVPVTTKGAGDSQNAGCSSSSSGGGEDFVVAFTLATDSDLHLEYAQFGDHAFAIFENNGPGFSCDALPVACQPASGTAMGKVTFNKLKAGEYFLIVEAAKSGDEGSVVMKLSTP